MAFSRTGRQGVFDRFLFVPGLYAKVGRPERIRVLYDEGYGLTRLLDETCTSETVLAEGLEEPEVDWTLSQEQVEWLHATLGSLLERWGDGRLE